MLSQKRNDDFRVAPRGTKLYLRCAGSIFGTCLFQKQNGLFEAISKSPSWLANYATCAALGDSESGLEAGAATHTRTSRRLPAACSARCRAEMRSGAFRSPSSSTSETLLRRLRVGAAFCDGFVKRCGYCADPGFCAAVPGPLSALKTVTCTRRFFCRSSRVFSSFTGLSLPSPTIWMRYTGTLCCETR